jgi:hypothetical protein
MKRFFMVFIMAISVGLISTVFAGQVDLMPVAQSPNGTLAVYVDYTSGTTYTGTSTYGGDPIVPFGWYPPASGWGPTAKLIFRAVLPFDISSIPAGQSIDSAVISSWLVPDYPAYVVRYGPDIISGDVWLLSSGSAATSGIVDMSNSPANDWLSPGTFIGSIYTTGTNAQGQYFLDVTQAIKNVYDGGKKYATFRYQISDETTVQSDLVNPHHYSTGDAPAHADTTHRTHLIITYNISTTGVSNWELYDNEIITPVEHSKVIIREDEDFNIR